MLQAKKAVQRYCIISSASMENKFDRKTVSCFILWKKEKKRDTHSCKYCSAIGRHYRKEATKIKQFCEENKIFLQHESREIHVQMPLSHWKIVWNGKKERRSSIRRVYNLLEQLENYRKMKGEKIK